MIKCITIMKNLIQTEPAQKTMTMSLGFMRMIDQWSMKADGDLQRNKQFWFLLVFVRMVFILEGNRLNHRWVTLHGHTAGCRRVRSLLVNPDDKHTDKPTHLLKQHYVEMSVFLCVIWHSSQFVHTAVVYTNPRSATRWSGWHIDTIHPVTRHRTIKMTLKPLF